MQRQLKREIRDYKEKGDWWFGRAIRENRIKMGLSQEKAAELISNLYQVRLSPSYLSMIENGERKNLTWGLQMALRDFFFNLEQVKEMGFEIPSHTVPLLGTIRAGLPIIDQEPCGEVEIPADVRADFAVRVIGDSMSWAGITEGDIALCRDASKVQVRSGQIVAVSLEEDGWGATIKFYYEKGGYRCLRPANPNYKDILLEGKEYRVAGVVVKFLKEPPALADYERLLSPEEMEEKIKACAKKAAAFLKEQDLIKKKAHLQALIDHIEVRSEDDITIYYRI